MSFLRQLGIVAVLLLQLLPTLADDVITNVVSPIVSFQYPNDFTSEALANGGMSSPIVSYQYFEWPGDGVLQLNRSRDVSCYYQFLDGPSLTTVPTIRQPTDSEITKPTPGPLPEPPPPSVLKTYSGGEFTTEAPALNVNVMTIVLTHGWNSNPNEWAKDMASKLSDETIPAPNIVAWDWHDQASSSLCNPGLAESRTSDEGKALGAALLGKLGPTYAKEIHFIGHSFGTLVNASAADWLHGDKPGSQDASPKYSSSRTHMTLFDEAEIGQDVNCPAFALKLFQILNKTKNPFAPETANGHPLPKQSLWADNYVSAFGFLHLDAANVILTKNSPNNAPNVLTLVIALKEFHSYPQKWYDVSITDPRGDNALMGFRWSFEKGSLSPPPAKRTFFVQTSGSELNLRETDIGETADLQIARAEKYASLIRVESARFANNTFTAGGLVTGNILLTELGLLGNTIIDLRSSLHHGSFLQKGPRPNKADGGETNIPAYAWIPLAIPTDAVAMSFDFKIQGDWKDDSLAAALNGTNVLLLAGSSLETNLLVSSGTIDVSTFAGQTNEFFIGIVGGTSTNAQLTVQDIQFFGSAQPSLQAKASGGALLVSWPLSAQDFTLQYATNLAATNAWTTITNVPAVVDFQNAVTNPVLDGARFFRLRK